MTVVLVTHLFCASAFAILAGILLSGRERTRTSALLAAACGATVAWAVAGAFPDTVPMSLSALLESVRNVAWLGFLYSLLAPGLPWARVARLAIWGLGAFTVGIDLIVLVVAPAEQGLLQPQLLARIATAVLVLSLVENQYRNTPPEARWRVTPLCIALGAMFAFELFFHADVLLSRQIERPLEGARALADVIAVPLLALAMVRSGNWRADIRMSHEAAFHAVTLVSSGVFLLSVALVSVLFRGYGGQWGTILQITALFGSGVVLATVLSSETARSGIRMAILRNFFAYRYDYRVEWLRCIEALSPSDPGVALPERVVRAVATIVNSPGGVLFQLRDHAHVPTAFWNARAPADVREPADSDFVAGFRGGRWIQELDGRHGDSSSAAQPAWIAPDEFWLAVPLPRHGEVIGFVLLEAPRAPVHPDWEVFDLLRTVASQAAAYLSQQQAERSLADTRVLQEYSKRFAFVVHDIKNMSSQLGLILSNARRHGDNPEFQADVLHTVENSVGRMNNLLSQLRLASLPEGAPLAPALVDAAGLLHELARGHPQAARIDLVCDLASAPVLMEPEPLRSVLSHLINNALEASGASGRVRVSLGDEADRVTIDIADEGPGMEVSFVRDELFRPFRSTKQSGLGIGAFQTRELIRAAGGQLDVITRPGAGTTMRITLRAARAHSLVSPAA